ncbi:MAG: UDP-N-acetylmuramoyl-L-alanine--D-glutamate ligase [Deltaproteobacteria bacterium]|jgi:UDP-N-acetylmuramoylalanine--D-glutamate ligase|nr:UDP-N-acetylmuramoyl-L-alanine--D-glutamate ligase [Deltaproteobacteria bacterium]
MNFNRKKIVVVGLGKSGIATARYLCKQGASVVVSDQKAADQLVKECEALKGCDVQFSLGKNDPALFLGVDLIALSPGVPTTIPGLKEARAVGTDVVGDMEIASWKMDKPIVAITGTNGKTTTTSLTGHLLKHAGIKAVVGGNIGEPILDLMEEIEESDVVVLEMSSFQIETSPSLKPKIAAILNITPDHLDRHSSFEEYISCKAKLFERVIDGGSGIYNAGDDRVAQSILASKCNLFPFDAAGQLFSKENLKEGRAWFDGSNLCVWPYGGRVEKYALEGVPLKGVHNRENMLTALSICEILGAEPALLLEGLKSFKGLPHRMEYVNEINGISFFNDSKGTNVGATQRALEQFAEPVVLIAGGLAKGADLSSLKGMISERVKALVLIGESQDEMASLFEGCASIKKATSMEDAVSKAYASAEPGDVILLSPACASFDMFKNYAHRGEMFINSVDNISNEVRGSKG